MIPKQCLCCDGSVYCIISEFSTGGSYLGHRWSRAPPVQIIKVKEACEIARKVLDEVKEIVEPGVATDDLDNLDREYIVIHNAYPSPLNFKGFPKCISTSVNNIAAHGIPDRSFCFYFRK